MAQVKRRRGGRRAGGGEAGAGFRGGGFRRLIVGVAASGAALLAPVAAGQGLEDLRMRYPEVKVYMPHGRVLTVWGTPMTPNPCDPDSAGWICYGDCNGSGVLDFWDALCFQEAFVAGDSYADCDGDRQLDFFDFLCFQNAFAGGRP